MAKMVTFLTILLLFANLYANDTLFIQRPISHNVMYREDASGLYKALDYSEWIFGGVCSLFPEKNIGKEGVFFYTVETKNGFFFYKKAFISFEENTIYLVADPSEFAAAPSLSTRIGDCLKKHFLLNLEKYRDACAQMIPLNPKLKELINLIRTQYSDILSASRGDDVYVLVFYENGVEREFLIPDFSKMEGGGHSVVLDFYQEIYQLFHEFVKNDFPRCWWDKLINNPERFSIRSKTGEINEMRCTDP